MLIRGARIHSFRSLTDVDIPIGPVTVVIGRNGAGKTSVLEALGHLPALEGETARPNDRPAQMSWYLGFQTNEAARSAFLAANTDEGAVAEFCERFGDHLLVRYRGEVDTTANRAVGRRTSDDDESSHGLCWSFDRFRAFVDRTPTERTQLINEIAALRATTNDGPVAGSLVALRTAMSNAGSSEAFVDLPVLSPPAPDFVEVPNIISMFAAPTDVSPLLLRWLKRIAVEHFRGANREVDDALAALADGVLGPLEAQGLLQPVIDTWTALVNEIAPTFLSRRGRIELTSIDGPDNDVGRLFGAVRNSIAADRQTTNEAMRILAEQAAGVDRHLEALFVEAGHADTPFRYSRLGTGHRRWISATIDEAARLLVATAPRTVTDEDISLVQRSGRLTAPQPLSAPPARVRLIDEPVDSIESRIHGEVVAWLRSRVREREHLVMSTHQPSVLRVGADDGDLVVIGLTRSDRATSSVLFGPRLLQEFRTHMRELGIATSELMFLARGLLLVEGKNDEDVIRTLYDDELAARGVFVHGVGGSEADNIVAAFQHSAYEMLDIPTWVMLDRTSDDRLPNGFRYTGCETADSQVAAAQQIVHSLRPLPFGAPDIAFGIRPEVYGDALGCEPPLDGTEYETWLTDRSAATAKDRVCGYVGPDRGDGHPPTFSRDVLPRVLRHVRTERLGSTAASPWLASSMERLFEDFDAYWDAVNGDQELG